MCFTYLRISLVSACFARRLHVVFKPFVYPRFVRQLFLPLVIKFGDKVDALILRLLILNKSIRFRLSEDKQTLLNLPKMRKRFRGVKVIAKLLFGKRAFFVAVKLLQRVIIDL